ncbi:MAG: hypothetical protein IPQ07_29500 [Myxococcales bacterium]|nr:hypothetical protein [Myxococcales bacterium]
MSRFIVLSLSLSLIACGSTSTSSGPTSPGGAPTNTSIASAIALLPGAPLAFAVPCGGALYFGPFSFTTEGQALTIMADHKSRTGAQACAGAEWIDKDNVTVNPADGIGCPEGAGPPARSNLAYAYTPGAGGSAANPLYLKISADESHCGKSDVTLTRQ